MRGLTETRLCRTATPQGNSMVRGKGHTSHVAVDFGKGLCSTTPPG
jgi:hypothetical protein